MVKIEFEKKESFNYQNETLVKYLKSRQFYFVPINEYDKERFHCIIKCEEPSIELIPFFKKKKKTYKEFPLSFLTCEECTNEPPVPIVFSKKEVEDIIKDCGESYVSSESYFVHVVCNHEEEPKNKELLTD